MTLYQRMCRHVGPRAANSIVIVARALLIVALIILSNGWFNSFTYLRM